MNAASSEVIDLVRRACGGDSAALGELLDAHRPYLKIHFESAEKAALAATKIMIDAEGEPIVMDFGLARQVDSQDTKLTQDGAIVGSPAYMSPEQVKGESDRLGPATDIYSLGVILYELLTGQTPFRECQDDCGHQMI